MEFYQRKLTLLVISGKLNSSDPKYEFFKNNVIPCLVHEFVTTNWVKTKSFKCPFKNCGIYVYRRKHLEIHLMNEHSKQIPDGIFNECDISTEGK